jgi:hypothetical protein
MTRRYLHVGFNWADGKPRIDDLRPIMDKATNWVRYAPNCWILWSGRSPQDWYRRFKPILRDGDHVLVVELNMKERQGWLPKSAWDWIKEERTP